MLKMERKTLKLSHIESEWCTFQFIPCTVLILLLVKWKLFQSQQQWQQRNDNKTTIKSKYSNGERENWAYLHFKYQISILHEFFQFIANSTAVQWKKFVQCSNPNELYFSLKNCLKFLRFQRMVSRARIRRKRIRTGYKNKNAWFRCAIEIILWLNTDILRKLSLPSFTIWL